MSKVASPPGRLARPVGSTARREWFLVIRGVLVWVGVTVMTSACFVWQMRLRGPLVLQEDLLAFVSAFALSGAVCGVASVAIYGCTRRAFRLLLAFIAILALSVALTRGEVTRLVGAGGPRFNHAWEWSLSSLAFGLALGGSAGIVASGMVALFAFLTRRTITWKSGLVLDVLLVALGFWLLPQTIPRLAEWTCGLFRWRYGSGEEAVALAVCTGAALGCLIGPVVLTLVAGDRGRCDDG